MTEKTGKRQLCMGCSRPWGRCSSRWPSASATRRSSSSVCSRASPCPCRSPRWDRSVPSGPQTRASARSWPSSPPTCRYPRPLPFPTSCSSVPSSPCRFPAPSARRPSAGEGHFTCTASSLPSSTSPCTCSTTTTRPSTAPSPPRNCRRSAGARATSRRGLSPIGGSGPRACPN